jgi:hypothetical protein
MTPIQIAAFRALLEISEALHALLVRDWLALTLVALVLAVELAAALRKGA